MIMTKRLYILSLLSLSFSSGAIAQSSSNKNSNEFAGQVNTITTAVPFLTIAPDSRAGAMGDAGVASSPDANSAHWNASKFAFIDSKSGFSLSYTPWLKALVPDINLYYLSGFYKIDDKQTIAASLLYFALGEITSTNERGEIIGQLKPNEFAIDLSFARKIAEKLSGGVSLRYIYSDLTNGLTAEDSKAGMAVAGDVSVYYLTNVRLGQTPAQLSFGANISNIGNKISYRNTGNKNFLPTNLRIGTALKTNIDKYNAVTIMVDANKLLVPTPPAYDSTKYANGTALVSEQSVVSGMFSSFGDAPGGGSEELREINYSVGLEYLYDNQFALRGGFFHEDKTKGARQYFTLGFGLRYNVFGLDVAYLIPASEVNTTSPLANTLRFTLHFTFDAFKADN
jgi:hypothetical protein